MSNELESNVDLAEYAALRQEALWRVGLQQQVIHLAFATAAALAVIGALGDMDVRVRLLALLLGAFLSFALQARYTQQDLFVQAIGKYMVETLGQGAPGARFGRWERHLGAYLAQNPEVGGIAGALASIEGGLPAIVGALYLAAFLALAVLSRTQLANVPLALALAIGFSIDIAIGLFAVMAALRVARWIAGEMKKES